MVRQLLEGLNPERFQQSLLIGGCGLLTKWCGKNNIPVVRVPSTKLLASWVGLPAIASAFKRSRADAAILHGQWAGPVGAIAAKLAGIRRLIYVAHHPSFYHSTSLSRAIRNAIAEMISCRLSDRVVALSSRGRYNYLYRGWVAETRLQLIPNGVDPCKIPTASEISSIRKSWNFAPAPSRHAVFVGRIDDQKRVDWLIEAWDAAMVQKSRAADWHLWVVGSGKDIPHVRAAAQMSQFPDSIHFVGEQDNGMAWMGAADVVVMSSLYEGHALVPLEAMACAKPLASFATDGVGESVIHNVTGLLGPLGDTAVLGSNISKLMEDPDLSAQMGEASRVHLETHFPIKKTLAAYEELISRLVEP